MSENVNKEELLFLKSKHLNFSDDDLEWVFTLLKISKEDLDKKNIYVKRFIHEHVVHPQSFSGVGVSLEDFELAYDDMRRRSEYDQCKYFQLTKRFPDIYYGLCLKWSFHLHNIISDIISDIMETVAILNFGYYASVHNIQGYLYSLFCQWSEKSDNPKVPLAFDASRFEDSVEFMMKEQSMRVRHDKEVLALRSKEKETCSKYKETVAYVQAKAVENQLLVDERNALHTQLLNSGASHKRFKTNVSAYISKKNGLIRDLQTQFSELASKTESRLLELESKVPLEYGGFSVLESKNKELTEQLLACTAAKGVSDTQLEECKAEKEDLTEQLAHTQSLLLQSITSIGKRKRSVFDASQ
jgi:hypothetical protein